MSIVKINFEQTKELIDSNKEILIFDVREEEEYISGHISNAELFTLATINEETAREMIPSKDNQLLVYCRSGQRSARAAELLNDMGYSNIYDAGGLAGWPYGLE